MVSLMPFIPKNSVQGESRGKPQLLEHPGFPTAKFTKKWEIVHQATCTKHEHKDLQQRQQSSSSGEKIRIPSDVRAQRHNEQRFRNCSLPKGDTVDQRKQRVPKGTVLATQELQEFWVCPGMGWQDPAQQTRISHVHTMDCAQGLLLEREGGAGI